MALPFSEACERNRGPILEHLAPALAPARRVLEIGSGTGQHAEHFAAALPNLQWQPTEHPQAIDLLRPRIEAAILPNLCRPLALDVSQQPWAVPSADAIFTANTLHIMAWEQVQQFFLGAGQLLVTPRAALLVYGPFRYGGAFTTASNAAFDATLKARDSRSGIRDFEAVNRLAEAQGLALVADHALPANNQLLHWQRNCDLDHNPGWQ